MRKVKQKSALLLTVMLLFGVGFMGCKDTNDDSTVVLSQQDQTFAKNIASGNVAEIRFGELALQKAKNDSIQSFAQMMIRDHTKAQTSLDSLMKGLSYTVADSLDTAHKTLYSRLSGLTDSTAFDSVYINNQVLDHQATLTLLQNQVSNNTNGNQKLIDYARKQVPIVTRHLDEATRLRNSLKNNNNNNNNNTGGK